MQEIERLAKAKGAIEVAGPLEGFVARLIFSPEALERYRRRFVKSASPAEGSPASLSGALSPREALPASLPRAGRN